jgi:hypothetical protein
MVRFLLVGTRRGGAVAGASVAATTFRPESMIAPTIGRSEVQQAFEIAKPTSVTRSSGGSGGAEPLAADLENRERAGRTRGSVEYQ